MLTYADVWGCGWEQELMTVGRDVLRMRILTYADVCSRTGVWVGAGADDSGGRRAA